MNQSPLLSVHQSAGARLAESRPGAQTGTEACPIVLTYGDVPAEYEAAHSSCALFDTADRGLIRITGSDAASFLHSLLANEVRTLEPGQGNANLLLTAKGKVLHGFDLAAREGEILCSTEPGGADSLLGALDMYHFAEDVKLEQICEQHAPLSLCGVQAKSVIETLVGELPAMDDHSHVQRDWNSKPVRITALDVAGSSGFRIDAGPEFAEGLWAALVSAGARPAGQVVLDIMRCESGRAAFGADITDDIYPQEARLENAFSLTKGCYIGQEVVAKIDTYGGLNKRLMVLRVSHDDPVAPGTALSLEEKGELRSLGIVTSWAYSFVLDTGIVLAYIKRKHQEPGTSFQLDGASATIVESPLRDATA